MRVQRAPICRHQNVSGGTCRLDSHLPSLSVIRTDKRRSGGGSGLAVESGVVPVLYVPLGTAETCEVGQPLQGNLTIPGSPALCPDDLLCGQRHRTPSCGTDTKVPASRTSALWLVVHSARWRPGLDFSLHLTLPGSLPGVSSFVGYDTDSCGSRGSHGGHRGRGQGWWQRCCVSPDC